MKKPERAIEIGDHFLQTSADEAGAVRIMLANVYGTRMEGWETDFERAIEILRPVVSQRSRSINNRLAAMALSAGFFCSFGLQKLESMVTREGQLVSVSRLVVISPMASFFCHGDELK